MDRNLLLKSTLCIGLLMISLALTGYCTERQIQDLLNRVQVKSNEEIYSLCEEILNAGEPIILKICQELKPYGDDKNAKTLIRALINYTSTKSTEAQTLLSNALCKALKTSTSPEVKAFLISELELLGNPESVDAIAEYLSDEYLCDYAVRALTVIGTPQAYSHLKTHLQTSKDKCLQNIISSLATSGMSEILPELQNLYSNSTGKTKELLLYTIAKLERDPLAFYNLVKSDLEANDTNLRIQVVGAVLAQMKNVMEDGKTQPEHKKVLDNLLSFAKTNGLSEVECAVLNFYTNYPLPEVFDLFVRELENPSADVRAVALQFLARNYNSDIKKVLKEQLYKSSPDVKYQILDALLMTGDKTWFNEVSSLLNSSDALLRSKSIEVMVKLDSTKASKTLSKYLLKCESIKEVEEVKKALLQCPPEMVIKDLDKIIKKAKGDQLVAVLNILSERRASKFFGTSLKLAKSKDQKVRTSALESLGYLGSPQDIPLLMNEMLKPDNSDSDAYRSAIVTILKDTATPSDIIVERIKASSPEPNPLLISILSEVCDAPAVKLIEDWLNLPLPHNEGKVNLAISAVSQWRTPDILPVLIEFFTRNPQHPKKEDVWKAVLRCLSISGIENDEKVWVCQQLLSILPEKREEVLKYLGGIPTTDAFLLVSKFLDAPELRDVASASLVRLSLPSKANENGLIGKDIIPYLLKAKENVDNSLNQQIDEHIKKCEKAEPILPIVYSDDTDFIPLFNGKDLEGWEGYTRGFEVKYGKLICLPTCHLNLFTTKDYSNFILRFEFKLTPSANNGIGIRVPFMRHSAYDGLEIQILDDSDPSARGLQPWQHHGAIYGVLAPDPKAPLKKCGEWNQEEIIVNGNNIKVIVNGVKIIDANLSELASKPTPDGRNHPGLLNQTGRIALLGHGAKVEFRNIRIKEL